MSVFLALLPDADTAAALSELCDAVRSSLPADAPRHGWRTPAQWHATLAYLGESLAEDMQAQLGAAVAPIAANTSPLALPITGLAYWPGAGVLVANLVADDGLLALHARLRDAASTLGLPVERRKLQPHLTLAYLPKGTRTLPQPPAVAPPHAPLRADALHLLATRPGRYERLASWPLRAAA